MPMVYTYICPECGTKAEEVTVLPANWFSVSIPQSGEAGSSVEYFDTWNCLSIYAGAHID